MNDHDFDQAGAYALDALSPDERAAFEEHLVTCSTCQAEVAELRQVVGVLPLAIAMVEPPADLRNRIMAAVSDEIPARPRLVPVPAQRTPPRRVQMRSGAGLLAIAAAVIVAALGVWNVNLQQNVNDKQKTVSVANEVLRAELDHPIVATMPGHGPAQGATAKVIEPRHGNSVYMLVSGLPSTPSNKVYQLWVMSSGSHPVPVSAGVFMSTGPGVQYLKMPRPRVAYSLTALTVEPGPHGSKSPTTQPIMIGRFGA